MAVLKKAKGNKNLWTALLVCISLVLVFLGGTRYVNSLREDLMAEAVGSVLAITQQQQQSFDTFISGDRERLHSFANYFAKTSSTDVEGIQERLSAFADVGAIYTIINLSSGAYYNNMTDRTYQMDAETLDVYQNLNTGGVRNSYGSLYSKESRFGYYERFTFADGVSGMIQKSYNGAQVSEEFSLSFYNGEGLGFVTTGEGQIMLRSVDKSDRYPFDNIFDMLVYTAENQSSIDGFIRDINSDGTGTALLSGTDQDYIYTYVRVQSVEDWYLVSVIPSGAVMEEANRIIMSSRATVLIFVILVAVFLAFFLTIWRTQRDMEEKDQEIEYREGQFDIFTTYLADSTDDIYILLDMSDGSDGVVEYISPNVERILGISVQELEEDLVRINATSSQEGGHIARKDLLGMKAGESLEPVTVERINVRTQEHKWFRETAHCVSLQGKKKIIVYISDRTKERQTQDTLAEALEMAQVANKAKTTFLGSVSHDIRTPMNAIMGLTVLLREDAKDSERVLEYTQRIDAASQHLLGLINDVLDMNKIEGGNTTLNISEIDLSDIIDELNIIIRPQTRARQQTFEIYASSFTNERLLGDKVRINQILINILSNAVKYTQEGGRIEMSVTEMPPAMKGYNRIQFVVKDNGQGMSEDYLQIIFDPFSREQNISTNKIQGTGLGMAITKSLVELMGGSIRVESKVGEGSTFYVELELKIQKKENEDPTFFANSGVQRMIVADDSEEICQNVVRAMGKTGVLVDYATSGHQAVEMMRTAREGGQPYDLVLLDWKMPDLDGVGTARLIRKNYGKHIPILFFTAYDWKEIEGEAMEVGVEHFLPKPFFLCSFKAAIDRLRGRGKEAAQPLEPAESVVKGLHILVVDDVEVNRMILVKILTSLGATCDTAENGQDAVDKFAVSKTREYDLILMDVRMPVMNGHDATRTIRNSERSDAKDISIIAMTANAFVDDVRDALEAGMDAHVSKPIVLDQLKETIRDVLARKTSGM